jgi:t-SNARE complex subunit (syntaxin)
VSEEFVSRNEFNTFKNEVQELKEEVGEYKQLLMQIDKKCDVITERLENTTKVSDLQNENIETRITSKLEPMQKEIDEIKDSRKWLWRTIGAVIIGIVIKIIFDVSAYITNLPK